MMRDRMVFLGVIGAAVAGAACLLPPVLIVLFGSAVLAYAPPWLDLIFVPAFLVFSGVAISAWYRRWRRADSAGKGM